MIRRASLSLLILLLLLTGSISLAQLAPQGGLVMGPPRPDGFPLWVQDVNGLRLQLCLFTRNPAIPEAGPCEFEMAGDTIVEAAYWAATAEIDDPAFDRLILIMAVEAANDPAEGGQVLVNEVRLRINPAITTAQADRAAPGEPVGLPVGDYLVDTPFGSFTFNVPPNAPPGDVAPEPEQTITVDRVDIGVERHPRTGQLFVPANPRNPLVVRPGGFPEGKRLPGPINEFIAAVQAPRGFVGDVAEAPGADVEIEAPARRQPRALVGRGQPTQAPAPAAGAPQPLRNGGVFSVTFPPDSTGQSRTLSTNVFTVQGQIFGRAARTPGANVGRTAPAQ